LFLGFTLWFAGALLVGLSSYVWLINFRVFIEWEFFGGYTFSFTITLLGDWVRLRFAGLVLIISGSVMIYSSEYIGSDLNFYRFIILVGLFVLSIVLMILSPNMIRVLLGWDGLGLVSYCLVIYYQNAKSARAGILTILRNRVGDVAILLRIA
jgi:NADH-ubiquinone oxidoreductase chain 5